jgi:hypothetical protein
MNQPINSLYQFRDLIVVIRSASERTLDACKALLFKQFPHECVYLLNERPLEAALRKTYEIGIGTHADWLITLDADVLLREGAVSMLRTEAETLPKHYFQLEGLVHDKLTGLFRKAGYRIYRTKYLKDGLRKIPKNGTEIRPEFATLQRMAALGYPSLEINMVFGIHDYEQFYRDIYRKAFIHANKHQIWLPQLIQRWKSLAVADDDFRIALRGLYDGLMTSSVISVDARNYIESAEKAMRELGLNEKSLLPVENIGFNHVEAVLTDARDFPKQQNHQPLRAKLNRLKSRYFQLGAARIGPYIFGALLSDIGSKIKRLVEIGRSR